MRSSRTSSASSNSAASQFAAPMSSVAPSPASIVTPLSGAYPVVTLGFAWVILHERPSALQWAGIVSVLAGMVLTTAS